MKKIDIKNWKRREHFSFFSNMTNPFFGIVTEVECTNAYDLVKKNDWSFFAYYLHKSMVAINSIEELKLRIYKNEVVLFNQINAGATIGRDDGTFGFIYVEYNENFKIFNSDLQKEILEVKNSQGLRLNNDDIKSDLIRHSTIPWTSFTGLLHPTNLKKHESVPKITFGKFYIKENKKFLPISIEAHHGLVDGYHLALYLKEFQNQLNIK